MIPVKQTIIHNPPEVNGNCFAAVIASILEMPIEDVLPVQDRFDQQDWHIELFYWLKERGWLWRYAPEFKMMFTEGKIPAGTTHETFKDKPYFVTGKTNRFEGKVDHVCIYMNGQLIHDPHPDNAGLTTFEYFDIIEKL
jgi:hypothetical protein